MTAPALPVTEKDRAALKKMPASSTLPHRKVVRAKALLWAADGVANQEIARRAGVDSDTVRRWRARFADTGVAGVGVVAKGVAQIQEAILTWAEHWNADPKPFIWKATAADILAKVARGRAALNRHSNSQTDR